MAWADYLVADHAAAAYEAYWWTLGSLLLASGVPGISQTQSIVRCGEPLLRQKLISAGA